MKKTELIVALDVDTLAEAREIVEELGETVNHYKIGSQLFTACGPAVARFVQAKGKHVFLDLKFHDIPNTVARAVHSAVNLSAALERSMTPQAKASAPAVQGLFMLTVHTCGGREMMESAVAAAAQVAKDTGVRKPLIVGVTVLTSEEKKDNILHLVLERAALAQEAGLDGVVASCHEAAEIRKKFGKDFLIVTPGIRPKGTDAGDQKRVTTPFDAILNGSDFLVVGRPVVQAQSPLKSAQEILEEIQKAQDSLR